MKQVTPKNVKKKELNKKASKQKVRRKKRHPQYGTSKLEEYFAKNFLDKLGVEYQYQFEAKDIGRFYDFFIPNSDGSYGGLLVECDGDWWHANPDKYKDDELRGHQKRAKRVDEYKDKWALMHGIPLIRIWESDIRKKPHEVMDRLKERLYIQDEKIRKKGRDLGKKP